MNLTGVLFFSKLLGIVITFDNLTKYYFPDTKARGNIIWDGIRIFTLIMHYGVVKGWMIDE